MPVTINGNHFSIPAPLSFVKCRDICDDLMMPYSHTPDMACAGIGLSAVLHALYLTDIITQIRRIGNVRSEFPI